MLKPVIQDSRNRQLNAELFSAYLYWSMAAYFHALSLEGFANWMRAQAQEELTHAEKFYDHIVERGGRVLLATIEKPETEWDSPLAAFETTLKHEEKITSLIDEMADLAIEEKDYATLNFLQWFIAEQMEEEASIDPIVQRLKMVGDSKVGLLVLDKELGQRQS